MDDPRRLDEPPFAAPNVVQSQLRLRRWNAGARPARHLPGFCPPDGRLPLHSQPDQGPCPDGHCPDLVSARVASGLAATLPLTGCEHLPATPLVGQLTFRHPASYLTRVREGKTGGGSAFH
jgi:hypothetical protein